jgi:hypothetical protein
VVRADSFKFLPHIFRPLFESPTPLADETDIVWASFRDRLAEATPRIVGVEIRFGHPFGMPSEHRLQRRVLETAVTVLAGGSSPGTRVDVDVEWPVPTRDAYRAWQPLEPSPIVAHALKRSRAGETEP